jgi:hypothetical protein
VLPDFWAYRQGEYCVGQDVVQGYDDGLYHPERVVTRDQMAVICGAGVPVADVMFIASANFDACDLGGRR